jgi:hypothetical protein
MSDTDFPSLEGQRVLSEESTQPQSGHRVRSDILDRLRCQSENRSGAAPWPGEWRVVGNRGRTARVCTRAWILPRIAEGEGLEANRRWLNAEGCS